MQSTKPTMSFVKDVAVWLDKHHIQDHTVPGKHTSLFTTIPGRPVYIQIVDGMEGDTELASPFVVVSNQTSKEMVVEWLLNTSVNIWAYSSIDESNSGAVKVIITVDDPHCKDVKHYVHRALLAVCVRGDAIYSIQHSSRQKTIGVSTLGMSSTSASRTPL